MMAISVFEQEESMASEEISGEKTKAASQKVRERDFWLKRLAGDWQKTSFYYDHPEVTGPRTQKSLSFNFTGESFSDLMRLSNNSDQRLFMILAARLVLLLYKYTGHTDIMVGTPIYRQDTKGSFINTVLALRNTFEPGITFKQLLLQFRDTLVEAVEHQNYPIEVLVHKLNLPVSRGREHDFPLFDIAVLLENVHDRAYIKHINTNMSFYFRRLEGEVQGEIEYNSLLYNASTIEGIITHYKHLVRHITASLDTRLADREILTEEEKKQLLVDFNDTAGGAVGQDPGQYRRIRAWVPGGPEARRNTANVPGIK
jgi:non-ribosomal peptide synthetase component F